jgi:hypothetical protein
MSIVGTVSVGPSCMEVAGDVPRGFRCRVQTQEVQTVTSGAADHDGGPAIEDPLLAALEDLTTAAAEVDRAVETLSVRAARMRDERIRGAQWRDIVDSEERPLIAEILTETIVRFESAGTRFRRAKAAVLHEEGMTMDQIAALFGVSRQRISALLRERAAAGARAGEAAT